MNDPDRAYLKHEVDRITREQQAWWDEYERLCCPDQPKETSMRTVMTFVADLKPGDRVLLPVADGDRACTVERVQRDRWGFDLLARPDPDTDGEPQPLRWVGFGNRGRVPKIEGDESPMGFEGQPIYKRS
jgi:hypothetical protein